MLIIIGVHGKAFAGKTTFCEMVAKLFDKELWSTDVFGLADALKIEASNATGIPLETMHTPNKELKEMVRPLLQWWGTEFRRNPKLGGYEEYWLDRTEMRINEGVAGNDKPNRFVAIHDLRFINEAELVHSYGECSCTVHLDALDSSSTRFTAHVSENGIPAAHIDVTIQNNHSLGLENLQAQAEKFFNEHIVPRINLSSN